MDDDLDEEQQRKRRAGVGIEIELNDRPQQQAANDHPDWIRTDDGAWEMTVAGERVASLIPNPEQERYPDWWLSIGVGTDDLPNYGWENVDFDSLEAGKETLEKWWDHARNGEAYQPERPERPVVTREAIERDPWNAVALSMPLKADHELWTLIATTAAELRENLLERANEANTAGQQELWAQHAESARERQEVAAALASITEPMTREAIERDPWNAVALELPADADKALLQEAHAAVMQCCTYMAGPQGPTMNADDPLGIAAAESREQYFERAVRRLDELDGRLRAAPETMTQADADQWRAFVDSLPADQVRQDIRAEAEERDTIALAEAIDDDHRRHRDDPDAVRESAREDRFSSDRIDEVRQSREETAEPLYDRYTGERLDEAGQEHEAGHDLGGGGRGRSLFP
jgi:hypothetical protein